MVHTVIVKLPKTTSVPLLQLSGGGKNNGGGVGTEEGDGLETSF